MTTTQKKALGCLTAISVGILLGTILGSLPPAKQSVEEKDNYAAMAEAKAYVKAYLKYPDDAEFVDYPYASKLDHDCWAITGKVKTINAFGAKLTQDYAVELQHRNGKWSLKGISIGLEDLYTDQSER